MITPLRYLCLDTSHLFFAVAFEILLNVFKCYVFRLAQSPTYSDISAIGMRDRAGAATRTEPVTDFASRIHWEQYRRMYGSPLGHHSPYSPASFSGMYSVQMNVLQSPGPPLTVQSSLILRYVFCTDECTAVPWATTHHTVQLHSQVCILYR